MNLLASALTCAHGSVCPPHHGPLPFTGLNLVWIAAAAATLVLVGVTLWNRSRSVTSSEDTE